jgi:hypothetical protein
MRAFIRLPVGPWSIALYMALGLTGAAASAEPSAAPAFSADIVSRDAGGVAVGAVGRLYETNRKVRIETPSASAGYFLIDGETGTALFVQPTQRVFMAAKQSSRLTQIFVPVDLKDPCSQWQAAARDAGALNVDGIWDCKRSHAAIVEELGTIEYRVSRDLNSSQFWIDPDLEFPVKLRAADGTTIGLEHIRVEAQRASLFAVPPGFRKLDPQGLIDRLKHSDVWVAQPSAP